MTRHTHRASKTESETYGWSHCVVHGSCNGGSHGGVTFVDHCTCGAKRYTESNGRHIGRGPWITAKDSNA
jgi:hypothetical protein